MVNRYSLFAALLLFLNFAFAQVVTTIPAFPTPGNPVSIVFDATQGNAALLGVGPVYAHTGLITTASATPSDWQYTQGVWGTADPNVLMTNIGTNLWKIDYTSLYDFYSATVDDTILQMAFVFRNADGTIVGRDADGGDIFVTVYGDGLHTAITSPAIDPTIVEPGDNVHITAEATLNDSMYLYVNDVLLLAVEDSVINYDYTAVDFGLNNIRVKATSPVENDFDTSYFFVRNPVTIEAVPDGMQMGVNYINDSTATLVLFAPFKEYVFAPGEYSNWLLSDETYMKVDPDMATYWTTLTGLIPGQEYAYQYLIDGALTVADPLAEKILDPSSDSYIPAATYPDLKLYPSGRSGIVSVLQTAQPNYTWAVPDFTPAADKDLVIYELLIRDFVAAHDYNTLTDTLHYLKTLGVNAIELMPVMEFEGNESWGYNPSFFIALDKYYGTREAFKVFVDSCHANGIAVILDIAMNHAFGQCPLVQMWWDPTLNVPALNSPYFNQYPTHDYNVGYDFNHESTATINLRNRIFTYWMNEYNTDGYRFDLSKGYTQNNTLGDVGAWGMYDASRIAIWQNIGDTLWASNPNAKLILEHFADNSEETVLSNYGFLLWGNMNYNYNQGTMGYTGSDLNWASYISRGWDDPHVVAYMESHDEERLMFKNLTYGNSINTDYDAKDQLIARARMELAGAFFFTIPGPKMIWQFGELGYDISIDVPCRVCNKPILWDYYDVGSRLRIYQVWSELAKLKTAYPAFGTSNFNMSVGGFGKRINLNDAAMNVTVIGNFNVFNESVNPNFQHTGFWYEYFSGDTLNVGDIAATISLLPGEYRLYTDVKLGTPEIIVGVNEVLGNTKAGISVFPNPSSDQFNITATLEHAGNVFIDISNVSGQVIYSQNMGLQSSGDIRFTWNGNNVEPGLYFCRVVCGKDVKTGTLIVSR